VVDAARELEALLQRRPEVRLAYLFGSTARGEADDRSDLDVAIWDRPALDGRQWGELVESLEVATGRRVDLVSLTLAPPLLLRDVVRDGVVLVCRDEDERAEFELRAISTYLDTEHLRRVQREYQRARAEARRARPA
jgi:predicted nucleotidyltransferase